MSKETFPPIYDDIFAHVLGDDFRYQLTGKKFLYLWQTAGWGHGITARFLADATRQYLGPKVKIDVQEANHLAGDAANMFMMKAEILRAIHNKTDPIRHITELGLLKSPQAMVGANIISAALSLAGEGTSRYNERIQDKLGKNITKFGQSHPAAARTITRLLTTADTKLSDAAIGQAIEEYVKSNAIDAVGSTLPSVLRGFKGACSAYVLDPGYGGDNYTLFQPVSNEDAIMGMPTTELKEIAVKYFGLSADKLHVMGTIGPLENKKTVLKKWETAYPAKSGKKYKIMLSTSGNAASQLFISQTIREYVKARYEGRGERYELIVFLGEHRGQNLTQVFDELMNLPTEIRRNIQVVMTNSKEETFVRKAELLKDVHAEFVKPGEAPLANGQAAVATYCYPNEAENEGVNMLYALDRNSAVPSAFPASSNIRWSKFLIQHGWSRERINQIPGFDENVSSVDFIDFLDYQFGRNKERKNYAQEIALNGLENMDNGTVPYMLLMSALALKKQMTPEFMAKIGMAVDEIHAKEREIAKQAIADFKKKEGSNRNLSLMQYMEWNWRNAYDQKESIEEQMVDEMGMTEQQCIKRIGAKTKFVFIAGGAATRFSKDAQVDSRADVILDVALKPNGFNLGDSRALTPLPNFLPNVKSDYLETMGYSIDAIKEFLVDGGKNLVIVYNDDDNKIRMERVLEKIGIQHNNVQFVSQKIYEDRNKQAGNADAIKQANDAGLLEDKYENVMTFFNGDVHSKSTIRRSLYAFEYAKLSGKPLSLLIPSAYMSTPKYPIGINRYTGIPNGKFGQPKLQQGQTVTMTEGQSNIGIRIYDTKKLKRALDFADPKKYYRYRAQSKTSSEFAVDQIDEWLARGVLTEFENGHELSFDLIPDSNVRSFAIAHEREIISSIKSPLNIRLHIDSLFETLKDNNIVVVSKRMVETTEHWYKMLERWMKYFVYN